jgi:hypothetical protein
VSQAFEGLVPLHVRVNGRERVRDIVHTKHYLIAQRVQEFVAQPIPQVQQIVQ